MAIREPATFPRLTREDLTRTVVTPDDTRPLVGPADQCGYCESRVGEEHEPKCVCRKRPVLIELRIRMVVDRPESWGKEEIEFQINDGSYCAGNLIQALAESDDVAHEWSCCDSCARTEAEFIRPATDEDIEFLALLRRPEGECAPDPDDDLRRAIEPYLSSPMLPRPHRGHPHALTPAERSTIATAKVAASPETDSLIAIIERLAGEVVPAADGTNRRRGA